MTLIADRYERMEKLGQGGMGEVYRGLDTRTQLPVAIKHLRGTVSHDPEVLERFQREGVALRNLNHPNIVKMLDMVQHDDDYYLIMEYIQGGDLADLLKARGSLAVEEVIRMGLEIADALARAHHLGIIHRDIKPANVLIANDGTPRLTDFGVARVESQERLTGTGMAVGTLDYMPPEAVNGEAVDVRADIWALGVMLYEMLTGERPFEGATTLELLTTILTKPVPDIARRRPDIPPALADLIHHMLDKDREKRLRSVRQAGAALEAILQGEPVNPQHETPPRSPTTRSLATDTEPLGDMPLTSAPTLSLRSQRSWLWLLPVALVLVIGIGGAGLAASGILTPPTATPLPTATTIPTASPTLVPTTVPVSALAPEGYQWVNVDEARFLVPVDFIYVNVPEIVKVLSASSTTSEFQTALDAGVNFVDQQRTSAIYLNWLTLQTAGLLIEDTGLVLTPDEQINRVRNLLQIGGQEFIAEPEVVDLPIGKAVRFEFHALMNTTDATVIFYAYQRGATQYMLSFAGRADQTEALQPIIEAVTNSFYITDAVATPVPTEVVSGTPAPEGYQWASVDEVRFLVPLGYTHVASSEIVKVLSPSVVTSELQAALDPVITYFDQMRSSGMYINWLKLQTVGVLIEDTGLVLSTSEQIRRNLDLTESAGLEFSREPEIVDLPVGQAVRFESLATVNATEIYITFFTYQRGGTQYIIFFNGRVDTADALESTIETITNSFYIADEAVPTPVPTEVAAGTPAPDGYQWVSVDEARFLVPTSYMYMDVTNLVDVLRDSFLTDDLKTAFDVGVDYINQQRTLAVYLNWVTLHNIGLMIDDTGMELSPELQIERMREVLRAADADFAGEPEIIDLPTGQVIRFDLKMTMFPADSYMTFYAFQHNGTQYLMEFSGRVDKTGKIEGIIDTVTNSFYIADNVEVTPEATANPEATVAVAEDTASDWKTVTGDGFTLEMPQDWLTLPASEELIQSALSIFLSDDAANTERLEQLQLILKQFHIRLLFGQVAGMETAAAVVTLDSEQPVAVDFIETLLTTVSTDLGAELRGIESITLPSGPARHLRMYLPATGDKPAYEISVYMIDTSNGLYMLSFVAPDARYAELALLYEQIAQSFAVVPPPDQAADWKTVTGEGFMLELPKTWLALPANPELVESSMSLFFTDGVVREQIPQFVSQFNVRLLVGQVTGAQTAGAVVTLETLTGEPADVNFAEDFMTSYSAIIGAEVETSEAVLLPGGAARRLVITLPHVEDAIGYTAVVYMIDTPNGLYILNLATPNTRFAELLPTYEQIAQSFAVVPPADQAADWKKVTSEGFTLEMPNEWLALPATEELLQSSMTLFLPDDPAKATMQLVFDQFDVRLLFGQYTGAETAGAVMRLDTSAQPVSVDFVETLLTTITVDLNAEVRTTENVTLPSGAARHLRMYMPATGDKLAYEIGIYLVDTPNGLYLLSFIAPADRYTELAPLYEQIVQRFSVTSEVLIPADWKTITEAHFSLAMPKTWLVTPANDTVMRSGMGIFIPDETALNELLLFFDQFDAQLLFGQFVGDETAGAVFTIGSEYAVDAPFLETLLASITDKLGYTLHEPEIITLPSGTARRSRLSLPATGEKPAFEFSFYMINTPNGFYMLSFNTATSRYDELLPMYEQIARSFVTMP
jgi:serine/threonine protein kinase